MRQWLRRWMPKAWRIRIRLLQRWQEDRRSGLHRHFAKADTPTESWPHQITLEQPIFASHLAQNKVENMRLAIQSIEAVSIQPAAVFSFWRLVGPATPQRGFQPGRNLENGVLVAGYGGGLCQLAGILYHLSLMAGLEILERHAHSVDIYEEHERYAPLGADATVVYPFKDLRLRNPYPFPVGFGFALESDRITAKLYSAAALKSREVQFEREDLGTHWIIRTRVEAAPALYTSRYLKKNF